MTEQTSTDNENQLKAIYIANQRGELTDSQYTDIRKLFFEHIQITFRNWLIASASLTVLLTIGIYLRSSSSRQSFGALLEVSTVFSVAVASLFMLPDVWQAFVLLRVWLEAKSKSVTSALGEVVWHKGQFRPVVEGRSLRTYKDFMFNALPGPCEFFFLPRTKWVVFIKSSTTPTKVLSFIQAALCDVFHFLLKDLAENRQGRLSSRQKLRLYTLIAPQSLLLSVLIFLAGLGIGFIALNSAASTTLIGILGTFFIGGLALIMLWAAIRHALKTIRDLRSSIPQQIEGPIQIQAANEASHLIIHDRKFQIKPKAIKALFQIPHRVYYLEHTKGILSIEPLPIAE